jgi:hypothetical protein
MMEIAYKLHIVFIRKTANTKTVNNVGQLYLRCIAEKKRMIEKDNHEIQIKTIYILASRKAQKQESKLAKLQTEYGK